MDIGINFRQSSGYVTDGAGETYCTSSDGYPTTRGGATFGAVASGVNDRDRNSGIDRRLAGLNWYNADSDYFRLDLDATGDYDVHLAAGDASFEGSGTLEIRDGASTLLASISAPSGSGSFRDATDANYSSANWPSSESALTETFATTQLRIVRTSGNGMIAHVRVVDAGGGGATVPWAYYQQMQAMVG